jgi:hypothetical protein
MIEGSRATLNRIIRKVTKVYLQELLTHMILHFQLLRVHQYPSLLLLLSPFPFALFRALCSDRQQFIVTRLVPHHLDFAKKRKRVTKLIGMFSIFCASNKSDQKRE